MLFQNQSKLRQVADSKAEMLLEKKEDWYLTMVETADHPAASAAGRAEERMGGKTSHAPQKRAMRGPPRILQNNLFSRTSAVWSDWQDSYKKHDGNAC